MKLLFLIASYLLGAVPFGLILAATRGVDPRKAGSGNIGATNVMRTSGKTLGVLTLLCDVAKGFFPTALGKAFFGPEMGALAGLSAFLGHLFPPYLQFKGGKGVATAMGVFLSLSPLSLLVAVAAFILGVGLTRIVSVGSLLGALSLPFSLYFLGSPGWILLTGVMVTVLVFVKHRSNLKRIVEGTEHRL